MKSLRVPFAEVCAKTELKDGIGYDAKLEAAISRDGFRVTNPRKRDLQFYEGILPRMSDFASQLAH